MTLHVTLHTSGQKLAITATDVGTFSSLELADEGSNKTSTFIEHNAHGLKIALNLLAAVEIIRDRCVIATAAVVHEKARTAAGDAPYQEDAP